MKLLTFSTLFPNAEWPQHGIFVQTCLRQLVTSNKATSRVVAPVPWFPFRHRLFGEYAAFAKVPLGTDINLLPQYRISRVTRRYAEQFSWHAITAGQLRLFQRISKT